MMMTLISKIVYYLFNFRCYKYDKGTIYYCMLSYSNEGYEQNCGIDNSQ